MKTTVNVHIEYLGNFHSNKSNDYRIEKIVGAPFVEVDLNGARKVARIGDIITEDQAAELAKRTQVTTTRKS